MARRIERARSIGEHASRMADETNLVSRKGWISR
jgi:hypothetical protein